MKRSLHIVSLAVALMAGPVEGHEFWLAPSRFVAEPGIAVEIRALAGMGFQGEEKIWDPAHSVRFIARTARTVDLTRAGFAGDSVWVRFAPSDAGGAMLAFVSGFTSIEVPAEKFEKYLVEDGLDGPLAERRRTGTAAPGRERYRRCAKTWLAGLDVSRATAAIGLPLEIVPLTRPGASSILHARVLWHGEPLSGALVNAWRQPLVGSARRGPTPDTLGITWQGRTDARGEVSIPLADSGDWLVSLVHMVPCTVPEEADWESTWASLTFLKIALRYHTVQQQQRAVSGGIIPAGADGAPCEPRWCQGSRS